MSKMSIKWHEECLENQERYLLYLSHEYITAEQKYKKLKIENEKYRRQIERAKKLNKDGFDRERFKDE